MSLKTKILGEKNREDIIETIWVLKSERDRKSVKRFCHKNGLKTKDMDGNIRVKGKVKRYSKITQTPIHEFKDDEGKKYHQPYSAKNKNVRISKLIKIPTVFLILLV
jgi:hypothetical protein